MTRRHVLSALRQGCQWRRTRGELCQRLGRAVGSLKLVCGAFCLPDGTAPESRFGETTGSVTCARIEDPGGSGGEPVLHVEAGAGKVVSVPLPPPIAEPVAAMLAALVSFIGRDIGLNEGTQLR